MLPPAREPAPASTSPEHAAWAAVRALRERAVLAARVEALAIKLEAPAVLREIRDFVTETSARLELAVKHARRVTATSTARAS